MNIVICGAGEIGSHAAEVLNSRECSITVVDLDPDRLRRLEEDMDIATCMGNAAQAEVLVRAGADRADLVLAATDEDEVNLLAAAIAKRLGAERTIARVHGAAYFHQRGLDYGPALSIDRLICPEFATAQALARELRNPGAVAIERFARGSIEMQEFTADEGPAVGRPLMEAGLPAGVRLTMVQPGGSGEAFVPGGRTVVQPGDSVILVGNARVFERARSMFRRETLPRQRVTMMGAPPMAVWLCRALDQARFAIRLFETDRARAEQVAEELDRVTVINGDPTDRGVFDEENLAQSDVFISMLGSDEANIVAAVFAKVQGVDRVFTVVQKTKFIDVALDIGVDRTFSTRAEAAREILSVLDTSPVRVAGTLARGAVDVYQLRVDPGSPVTGRRLRDLPLSPDWIVAALDRAEEVFVPGADDQINQHDTLLIVGRHAEDARDKLAAIFRVAVPEAMAGGGGGG
jgi:trk system potassium uptake protein TrkA